ncbi:peptidase M23 [Vibrio sp. 10N.286.49.B3]|uniref:peptidoglycan DD-metalloendopeptidase family protein n=1 Tax=Vibrio sp. 10N.286.49.B3 TaxID=1880855 RepID=UPI000C842DD2|nr:peptidoglycan DD-metalloendopeptidase family protein [Vibrio sp. 10N.286.49.B3]PMH41210.1 peptidase M23 [Vibrio sp. 10N.286.49.B3]
MLSIFTRLPRIHRILIAFFSAVIFVAVFLLPNEHGTQRDEKHFIVGQHYPISIDAERLIPQNQSSELSSVVMKWEKHTVRPGESSAILFNRIGLSARTLHDLLNTNDDIKKQLSNLRPKDEFTFGFDEQNNFVQLQRNLSTNETFIITRTDDGFHSEIETKEIEYQYNYAEESITSNFWNAGISAGLTANQIMELAGIFGWDIDFALDIRKNDSFKILYQEQVVEGEVVGRGKIIAAIFKNQNDEFTAILDKNSNSYYDQNGRAMKKAFLRSPIDFRRVTSNFNPNRRHPVTGRVTAHRGTDYAAPVGTPIWAAGDGIVDKSGYNQFNGNYVFIRHSNTYITKYLHMQRRMVKTGERVKQGQTIGTLGGTGRVTGPHLHYEFLVNGQHKNPRTVTLPQSKSLTGQAKATFIANSENYLNQLERYGKLLTANPSK